MKISKIHQHLSNILNNPRVLEHPEAFLGPNWKAVLNFWIYLDNLTGEQWDVFYKRYHDMSDDEWDAAYFVAKEAAEKITSYLMDIYRAAFYCAGCATWELISHHELLNQQKPFIFLPLFLNL